jgi:hypothetical protein
MRAAQSPVQRHHFGNQRLAQFDTRTTGHRDLIGLRRRTKVTMGLNDPLRSAP